MTPARKNARTPRRAVGVVRISKNRPDETSTATQEEKIRAYCDAHGLDVVDITTDTGRSAYKASRDSRKGLQRARQLIEAGAADTLVCWRIDRVARNARDLLNLIHDLEADGGAFASVCEQFDTGTPIGKLVVTVIGGIAEMESAIKSERVSAWQDHRRANAMPPTGPRPYGYRRQRNQLHVDQAEANVIRTVARTILDGGSVRAAVSTINAAGGRSDGRPLTHRGLVRILTSPTIAALRPVEGTVVDWYKDGQRGALVACDAWEPILDRPTWESLHHLLLDPARRLNYSTGRRFLLSGLLECGKCGKAMRSKSTHPKGPRYQCPTEHLSIPAADTDRVVERLILDTLDLAAWRRLKARGRRRVDTAELERNLAELVGQYERDEITFPEWQGMRAAVVGRLEDAASEPVQLPNVDDPRKAWPDLDIEARRLIVVAVLPRIVIGPATPGRSSFDEGRVVVVPVDGEQSQSPAA